MKLEYEAFLPVPGCASVQLKFCLDAHAGAAASCYDGAQTFPYSCAQSNSSTRRPALVSLLDRSLKGRHRPLHALQVGATRSSIAARSHVV
jgi:hypothetical protein